MKNVTIEDLVKDYARIIDEQKEIIAKLKDVNNEPLGDNIEPTMSSVIALRSTRAVLWMAARPHYCDRGRVLVHVEPRDPDMFVVDHADFFPRYYFSLERAKAEMTDWLKARKEKVLVDWTVVPSLEFDPHTFGEPDSRGAEPDAEDR